MIAIVLSTSVSRVLLNGIPGDSIRHGHGLRQGDPLSPLLFVLAIDPLHHILAKATSQGQLHPILARTETLCASLYADDAAIFVKPIKEDIQFLASTLANFGEVTGLVTNCAKSHVAPIRCNDVALDDILMSFPAIQTTFPMRYLGLPLSVRDFGESTFNIWKTRWPENSLLGLADILRRRVALFLSRRSSLL